MAIRTKPRVRVKAWTDNASVDSMQNLISGMGTEKDKTFNTTFGFTSMQRDQLDAAYRGDWVSRKGVDIPAYDATREWREWQADPDDVTEIETLEKDLGIQQKVMLAMQRGRLYGGGALVLGIDQGKPEEPVDLDKLDIDCLQFVHVVSRYELFAGEIEWDILSPYYGEPKYYEQSNPLTASVKMHPSRIVRFIGNPIPDLRLFQGWGDSILQAVTDAIYGVGTVSGSVAHMVSEAKLDVIRIPGLSENIVNAEYEARLSKRFSFANMVKSVFSMLLLDKEEEWERITSNFAGLPDILQMYLLIACGALDIPATRFLGQSPSGLSATGDSDTRNYYDRISAEQKSTLQPNLSRMDEVLIRSALGKMPARGPGDQAEIHYNWRPLWQLTDAEQGALALQKAQVMTADMTAGLINTVVLKKAREAQLEADGTYPGLSQLIDEFDDDPEMEQQIAEEEANAAHQQEMQGAQLAALQNPQLAGRPGQKLLAPPKKPASPAAAKGPKKDAAIDGMVKRLQDATTPRTLYVRRELLNQNDLKAWARNAGFATSLTDMHVTVAYSKEPVDWIKAGADTWGNDKDGKLTIPAGGPRVLEKFGNAIVLAFASTDLSWRWRSICESTGAIWSYDDYTPHVTITYDPGTVDFEGLQAYAGPLEFGPEIFEEIKSGFDNEQHSAEDAEVVNKDGSPFDDASPYHRVVHHKVVDTGNPYHRGPGSPEGGEFTSGPQGVSVANKLPVMKTWKDYFGNDRPYNDNPNSWKTPKEADDGLYGRHGIPLAGYSDSNIPGKMIVEKAVEADRVLQDLKTRFPGLHSSLQPGVKEGTPLVKLGGGIEFIKGKTFGEPGKGTLGDYNLQDHKIRLASSMARGDGTLKDRSWTVTDKAMGGTLRHEMGHAVMDNYNFEVRKVDGGISSTDSFLDVRRRGSATKPGSKMDPFPSMYARSNSKEHFAESFAAYTHPDYARGRIKIDPELERGFDHIFKGIKA